MPHNSDRLVSWRVYDNLEFLYIPFRQEIAELLLVIRQNQLPFLVYETFRTPLRQQYLNKRKYSTDISSYDNSHVNGLAVDFLLDRRVVRSASAIASVSENNVVGSATEWKEAQNERMVFNIGTNILSSTSNPPRTVEQDRTILRMWNDLGKIINNQFPNLVWGGDRDKKKNQLIGADPTHVEYRDAKTLIRSRYAIKQLRALGAPTLPKGDMI